MKILDRDSNVVLDIDVDDNSYRSRQIMGENTLTLYFSLPKYVDIPIGAYTDFEGERYTLEFPESIKMHHTRYFEYTVTMHSVYYKSKIWMFRNTVDGRLKFPLTAKPKEHLQMFVDNMNRRDNGWAVGKCIEGVETLINYDHAHCWDALGQMAETFKTEFEIKGKIVSLAKVEYNKENPLPLSYGRGNGFKSGVGRTNDGENPPIEILYAQGGDKNIDRSKYGASELHLPKSGTISYDGEHFENEEGFDASNAKKYIADADGLSIRRIGGNMLSCAEESLDCSAVYPKRVGKVTEVVTADGKKHFYDFIDDSIPDNLNYEDCLIAGEKMTIIFQDGMLAGREFDVSYNHKPKGKKKGHRFEIVPQEIDGQTMPNSTFMPAVGNSYAVFHCMLPNAYINAHVKDTDPKEGAEWEMMRQCVKYLYEHENQSFTFSGTLDGLWAKKDWKNIGGKIILGGCVLFSDERFQQEGVRVRIVGIKDYINNPHSPEIDLSNTTVSGSFRTSMKELESVEVAVEKNHKEALEFAKRRYRESKETITMLNDAMLSGFTGGINPLTVHAMLLLAGDESLQFRYVDNSSSLNQIDDGIIYERNTKILHCPKRTIQHMTLGINTLSGNHSSSEYKFFSISAYKSAVLADKEKRYYIYIKINLDEKSGEYMLSEKSRQMREIGNTQYIYLLVGILNSEYDGNRNLVRLYGFTEILPSRITTSRIVSSDGKSYLDLDTGAMKLGDSLLYNYEGLKLNFLASEGAEIGGWVNQGGKLYSKNGLSCLDGNTGFIATTGSLLKKMVHITKDNYKDYIVKDEFEGEYGIDNYYIDFFKTGTLVMLDFYPEDDKENNIFYSRYIILPSFLYDDKDSTEYKNMARSYIDTSIILYNNSGKQIAISGRVQEEGNQGYFNTFFINHGEGAKFNCVIKRAIRFDFDEKKLENVKSDRELEEVFWVMEQKFKFTS